MADFKAAYRGSRSMRAGIIWLVLVTFWETGAETVMDFRVGVERLTEGRLKAAGSMSGIFRNSGCWGRVGRWNYRVVRRIVEI